MPPVRLLVCAIVVGVASGRSAEAQDSTHIAAAVTVVVRSGGAALPNATVRAGRAGAISDGAGRARLQVDTGPQVITVTRLGFRPDTLSLVGRPGMDTTLVADLTEQAAILSGVVVTSTRTQRRLEEEPLRIEVLAGDDVSEKNEMRPADLRTLFTEMSGVRVQTTSPALGAAAVRVQGLSGRYTMVLNDGLPLYGTHASGFGLVQQPPLDLRQAEVIKGAASALYGPSALGGVVDLISRRPPDTSQVLLNQTARGGSDALGFLARQIANRVGLTVLGGAHYQRAVDPDHDGWTDVAGLRRAELRPRLFYDDSAGHSLMLTAGGFSEVRAGGLTTPAATSPIPGSMLRDSLATDHGDVGAVASWRLTDAWSLGARAAANVQARRRLFAGVTEHERQRTLFGEITATGTSPSNTLVAGLSWQQEGYRNRDVPRFDQTLATPAIFVQHTWTPVTWLASTLNGRCDASNQYGTICTPRASLLLRPDALLSVRASVGGGWFAPMALDDETEVIGLTRVTEPVPLEPERARTASLDITATRGPLQVNGTLFQNGVSHPVSLQSIPGDTTGRVALVNAPGRLRTQGGELFAVYNEEPIVATAYYGITHSRELTPETGQPREVPLTPRQAAGLDVALEDDESGAYVAVEVFHTGVQALDENPYRTLSRPYTTLGLLGAMRFGSATVFLNLENLTDVLQTHYDPILRPLAAGVGQAGAWTVPAWAPLEGRTGNVGVRYAF